MMVLTKITDKEKKVTQKLHNTSEQDYIVTLQNLPEILTEKPHQSQKHTLTVQTGRFSISVLV